MKLDIVLGNLENPFCFRRPIEVGLAAGQCCIPLSVAVGEKECCSRKAHRTILSLKQPSVVFLKMGSSRHSSEPMLAHYEFGCVPALQSDGAARSIPAPARCGFGVRFARPGPLRLSASPRMQAIAKIPKPPMNSRGLSSEEGQRYSAGIPVKGLTASTWRGEIRRLQSAFFFWRSKE